MAFYATAMILILLLTIDKNEHREKADLEMEKTEHFRGYDKIADHMENEEDKETTHMLNSLSANNGERENISEGKKKKRTEILRAALQKLLNPCTSMFKVPPGVQNKNYYLNVQCVDLDFCVVIRSRDKGG